MLRIPRWLFVVAGLLLLPVLTLAQTSDTATLRGRVLDPSQAVLAGSKVTATNSLTGAVRTTTTDAQGVYTFAGLPIAGSYTLAASHDGFQPNETPNLTLMGGVTATVDLHLGVNGLSKEVTVTGTVGEVRADMPQLGDHLDARQIQNTPLLGNQITALPLLNSINTPAINQGDIFTNQTLINTGGSGRRQTAFAVDGSTANDSWGRQTIFTALPPDAVQEMTVLSNAFSAEYGATTGGVVNLVTKSGGQKVHGDGQYSFRPNGMAAQLAGYGSGSTSAHPTNDIFNQADWSMSGPVTDKTQYAISGEMTWRRRDSPVTSPLASGNFAGRYRAGLLSGRLDHQFSDTHNVFFRGSEDSFLDTNPNGSVGGNTLPSTDRVFKRRTFSAVLGDNKSFGPNVVNALRLQFQLASPITQFDPVNNGTAYVVPITGYQTFTSGTSQSALLLNRQYEVADTVSGTWGGHDVKFGVDVIASHNGGNSKEFGGPIYLGSFTFAACDPAAAGHSVAWCESPAFINYGNVVSFTQSFGTGSYTVNDTLTSLFAQDNYHLRPNLTLNLGVRYERQSFTNATRDFAPRLGFAYSPWAGTVVRGGYGIYYSQIHDNSEADYTLSGPTGVFNLTAKPGDPGFPTSLQPWSSFPTGAAVPRRSLVLKPGMASYYDQFLPTSVLNGYPGSLLNPYSEQWTLGVEHSFPRNWVLSADYIGSRTLRIDRNLDLDSAPAFTRTAQNQWRGVTWTGNTATCDATGSTLTTTAQFTACASNAYNAARPLWIYDAAHGITPAYDTVDVTVNDGLAWYDALTVNANHKFSHNLQGLISYTWSHALSTVDPDTTKQAPNDPAVTGLAEKGNTIFDQRHRLVVSGLYAAPFQITVGGIATLASGTPYNLVTGTSNGGDGREEGDRPVINGVVIARNSGTGTPIYSFDPFVERPFRLGENYRLRLRMEAFNVFNHGNFVSFNGTYGNDITAPVSLGSSSNGLSSQLTPREIQFSARLSF
jgi:outer membrane receptor protein involved in Fe transport